MPTTDSTLFPSSAHPLDPSIATLLQSIRVGRVQTMRNLGVVPLLAPVRPDPDYVGTEIAFADERFLVTEISDGGSVPELRVVNRTDRNVLLIDGDELRGAKQNRVLNTTILAAAGSDIRIPVSCTEQGRWRYDSPHFAASEHVMPPRMRSRKTHHVSESLKATMSYASDQGDVWQSIEELHQASGSHASSATRAMRDAFSGLEREIEEFVAAIAPVDDQLGLLVLIDGQVASLDLVSRPDVYRPLHRRLLRGAAMGALADRQKEIARSLRPDARIEEVALLVHRLRRLLGPGAVDEATLKNLIAERFGPRPDDGRENGPESTGPTPDEIEQIALTFLQASLALEDESFPSKGLGHDHRLEGEAILGSALVVDQTPVHLVLFPRSGTADVRRRPTEVGDR